MPEEIASEVKRVKGSPKKGGQEIPRDPAMQAGERSKNPADKPPTTPPREAPIPERTPEGGVTVGNSGLEEG